MAKPYRRGPEFRHLKGPSLLRCHAVDLKRYLGLGVRLGLGMASHEHIPYPGFYFFPLMNGYLHMCGNHTSLQWARPVFGPKSTANTSRVADLQPLATGLSFAPSVPYRKGLFQNTRRLVFQCKAILPPQNTPSSCMPFLGTHPSGREGSCAQHLKQHRKLLMLFSSFDT